MVLGNKITKCYKSFMPIRETTKLDAIIGTKVREARKAADMSQVELADLFGCEQSYVSMLEKGQRTWMTKWIEIACSTFNLDLVGIFGGVVLSENDRRDLDLIRQHREATQARDEALATIKTKLSRKQKEPKR